MFAGGGILPQWIEISNGSRSEEINLSGWTLTVDNAAADADVSIGASATFTIADGTTIDPSGQQDSASTILVVTEQGRNNVEDSGQVLDLMKSNEVDLILAGVVTRKYTLLSGMAFMVTLAPPEPEKRRSHQQTKRQGRRQHGQPLIRKLQPSAKRRPIWSVTSVLTVLPHGHCQ